MKTENKKESSSKKNNFLKILLLIIYLIVLIFLYIILMEFGINPLLIILILGFVLLLFVGSLFRKKKQKSIYSKMFPDKKKRRSQDFHRKLELKIERTPEKPAQKDFKEVNLNFKYRKSLINKCENCGMIITSYSKNCPTCGQALGMKEIVKKCKNCGMLITKSVKVCPICRKRTI
ncbi:hypothetical protein ES705_07872 [subsurface metagenome]|nr:MAG: hypothetical protein CEE42_03720 [Candidatus Lokiarchaeota archaeon Loki_b31]